MTTTRSSGSRLRRACGLRLLALAAFTLAIGACGRENPVAVRTYSLSGPVVLSGYLVDDDGAFAGTRIVGDADGVAVELTDGRRVLARTTTHAGTYRFDAVAPGSYRTRARVNGAVSDESNDLTVTHSDLVAKDTLRLESSGDLYPVPNPVEQLGTVIFFDIPDTGSVALAVLDTRGEKIRTLSYINIADNLYQGYWNGLDAADQPATEPLYWVTYEGPGGPRAQLLFR